MSSLGMNIHGDVRSASEFKQIVDDGGRPYGPYRCPFCEVRYEERCIVTDCVRAPHFKLPKNTSHRGSCNGEAGEVVPSGKTEPSIEPKRTVVGVIELPEALVNRRKATKVRGPADDGSGTPPDDAEVARRRRIVASDRTISSRYTTSQLQAIISAYKKLKSHAYEVAIAAGLTKGTKQYNESFGKTLDARPLDLYGQKLTYGNAFQGSKLIPNRKERVYSGSGLVRANGDYFIVEDEDSWPKSKTEHVHFSLKIARLLVPDAPTSHQRALEELERHAAAGRSMRWHAYGLAVLRDERFELLIDSFDHICWTGIYKR
ncbi:hypothetical protein [Cupriavidus campinensis]|uniref:Uncharacterized protein n=1 Tax=Cupriavidus campinensis TaxID=151783 RepID=A0ABY3EE59_9BURK|nr:hypothetical protein [Cupriavidus campinensis]TSP09186.1 hypothetical protein FGG12_29010 [Cupriavidus campinensis]